jgi:hypothetical protein
LPNQFFATTAGERRRRGERNAVTRFERLRAKQVNATSRVSTALDDL